MRIAVLSDIHDNIWTLEKALRKCRKTDAMIFCGDFCAPFTLKQLAEHAGKPLHVVFGNNDGDRHLLATVGAHYPHVHLHGEFAKFEIGGLKIGVNHYPEIAVELARSGSFDAVFYGHNHQMAIDRVNKADLINPGEIMGRFGRPTFAFYDTVSRRAEVVDVLDHNNPGS